MADDVDAILASCRLLTHVRGPARDALRAMARVERFARGDRIFDQGDPCPGLYAVGRGLVRVFKLAPSGKEHVLHLAAPGDTFAEVAAVGGFDCPAHAEALEETACLLLPTGPLVEALAEDHELCLQVLQGMTGWIRHLIGLVEDITLRDAAGRVARHLGEVAGGSGAVDLLAAKKHLASHLNLTSETLSRTLRRLTEAGLISADDRGRIRVTDAAGLRAAADGLYPRL
jgi:CRP-like cAMP-binding protein